MSRGEGTSFGPPQRDGSPEAEGAIAESAPAGVVPPRQRRPYRKPAFACERLFETSALSCGKTNETQAQCHLNQKTS